jgi:hypothetical protein
MDSLPDDLRSKIHKYKHEMNISKSLEIIKRLNVEENDCDAIELQQQIDLENMASGDDESNISSDDTDTLEEISEDIEQLMNPRASNYREQMEYYFVSASNLVLCIEWQEQLQVLVDSRHILIDLQCDCDYFYDEHFFDISMNTYGSDIWSKLQNHLNITIHKSVLSRSPICNKHNRYSQIYLTYNDQVPVRVCDIIYLLQELNIKALYSHRFLEKIYLNGETDFDNKTFNIVHLFCGS